MAKEGKTYCNNRDIRIGVHDFQRNKYSMIPISRHIQFAANTLAIEEFSDAFGELGGSWCFVLKSVGMIWESAVIVEELCVFGLTGYKHLVGTVEELEKRKEGGKKSAGRTESTGEDLALLFYSHPMP